MKHTQSWLQGALSTGEGWIKNAESFMHKHRYLIGGAIGGAAIGLAGLAGQAPPPGAAPPGGLVRDGTHAPPGGIVRDVTHPPPGGIVVDARDAPPGGVYHDGGTRWVADTLPDFLDRQLPSFVL